jgi:hypothetical protein
MIVDFETLCFDKTCDIDSIINNFFTKYKDIIYGDKEYITYIIKKQISVDRNKLGRMNEESHNPLNINGLTSYIKHYVIPEKNNMKEYYIYRIDSFI